ASQVVSSQPVNDTGQIVEALCRIVGIAKVLRPATHLGVDVQEQIERWDLRVATPALDLFLEVALFFRGNAQSQPARPIRVAPATQVIAQESKALVPMRDARLQRVLGEPQARL